MAFGSTIEPPQGGYESISLDHVLAFLEDYIRKNWDMIRHAEFKDPAFGFLALLEKARRGQVLARESRPARVDPGVGRHAV